MPFHTILHGGSGDSHNNASAVASKNKRSSSSKAVKRGSDTAPNGSNGNNGSDGPPKKRGRPSTYHPSQSCGLYGHKQVVILE